MNFAMLAREWRRFCAVLGWCGVGLIVLVSRGTAETNPGAGPQRFEPAIRAFEAADRTNPPPRDAILLVGSSSIRLWTNAPQQFPAHRLILRGFGGSHVADCVAYADRIVIPYRPRLILFYAGDNDLHAGITPEQVCADFQAFVAKVHAALPDTHIAWISIKPSPARSRLLDAARTANRLVREWIATRARLHYLDVFTPMLDAWGQPRPELFVSDRLHLNDAGYAQWADVVRPFLEREFPERVSGP